MSEVLDRKRQLIVENARLRQEISTQLDAIEASLDWVNAGARLGGTIRRNSGMAIGTVGGLLMAWKLIKRLRGHKEEEEPEAKSPAHGQEEGSLVSRLLKGGMEAAALIGPILKMLR